MYFKVILSLSTVHGKLGYDHQQAGLCQVREERAGGKPTQLAVKRRNTQRFQR